MDHLQGYFGKRRSKKEAIAIATDVFKFLAFCNEDYNYDWAVPFVQAVIVEAIAISCFHRILGVGGLVDAKNVDKICST